MTKSRKHRRYPPNFHRRTAPGAPPGTLVADPAAGKPVVRLIAYGPAGFVERELATPVDYEAVRRVDGATLATGHTVHATVDLTGRPVRMPVRVKELFS